MFGQLPCLQHGQLELAQSHAIERYLARRHGLYGNSDAEAAMIDVICEGEADLFNMFRSMLFTKDDALHVSAV